jgi:hypothetical protein
MEKNLMYGGLCINRSKSKMRKMGLTGFEKEQAFHLFKNLISDLGGLFIFRGVRFRCRCKCVDVPDGRLVVDILAYYDPGTKEVFVCSRNLNKAINAYKLDVSCARMFILYVLLHEFVHYALDYLGFRPLLTRLPDKVRFDEPFCEYVALRSCVEGRLRLFGSIIRELPGKEDEKRCVPLFSTFSRPVPYSYFNRIYAPQEGLLNVSAEAIFMKFVKMFSRIPAVNSDPITLTRMLFIDPTTELALRVIKPYMRLLQKIPAVGVLWCD